MTSEDFREHCRATQFEIPRRLNYLSEQFPKVNWCTARRLYRIAVAQTLEVFGKETMYDIAWGKGYLYAREKFIEMLEDYMKFRGE